MARRIFAFRPTAPANTSPNAPLTTDLRIPDGIVDEIEIIIPDGHLGLTGLRLAFAGQQVIPENFGAWVQGNDEKMSWALEGFPSSGSWQAQTMNTDEVFEHGFMVRFLCSLLPVPGVVERGLLPVTEIEPIAGILAPVTPAPVSPAPAPVADVGEPEELPPEPQEGEEIPDDALIPPPPPIGPEEPSEGVSPTSPARGEPLEPSPLRSPGR